MSEQTRELGLRPLHGRHPASYTAMLNDYVRRDLEYETDVAAFLGSALPRVP